MPQIIDFGPPYGRISYPDDATDAQIAADYRTLQSRQPQSVPVESYLRHIPGEIIRSAVSGVAELPKFVGILGSEIRRATGGQLPGAELAEPQELAPYQLGAFMERTAKELTPPPVPELQDSFLATTVPRAVGSGLGFIAGGGLGKAGIGLLRRGFTSAATRAAERELLEEAAKEGAPRLLRAGAAVSQGAEIAALGAASQFNQAYEEALAKGADKDTALKAGLISLPIGASEIVPLGNMLRRLDGISGGSFSRYLITAGKETFEEALQEAAQNFASNAVAQGLYDPTRKLLDDVAPNAAAGGISGFLLSTLTQALGGARARSRPTTQPPPPDATQTRTPSPPPSPQEGLLEGTPGQVRVLDSQENRLATQAGTPLAQQVFESRVAGTPAPFRPEQLMGPFGFRSTALLNQLGPMTGQQMLGTLRNSVPPSEFNALPGLPEFLASKPKVTPQEVQQWIAQNGPKVEAKVLRSGEGGLNQDEARDQAEQAQLRHEFYDDLPDRQRINVDYFLREYMEDPTSPDAASWRNQFISELPTGIPPNERQLWIAQLDRYAQLAYMLNSGHLEYEGFDPDVYRSIAPKDADQTVVMARVPATRSARGTIIGRDAILHKGQHFGQEDLNVLGWARIQYQYQAGRKVANIIEVQSDWAQRLRERREAATREGVVEGLRPRLQQNAQELEHPLLRDYNRLVLKAAIDQAIKDGAQSIVISDAETAMMTEGHDLTARTEGSFPTRESAEQYLLKYPDPNAEIVTLSNGWFGIRTGLLQEKGMRLNYDTILPKIMEELTGVRGQPVDLGPHQKAFIRSDAHPDHPTTTGRDEFIPRRNLIFRNPDGTPKTSTTGREYDLTKVKAKLAREGGFTLFGSDRISSTQQSRIENKTGFSITTAAVEQYLRENYGLPVQAQVVVRGEPTAQWDARSIFENGNLLRIELNAANISSLEQIDAAIEHEFAHAVELTGEVAGALDLLSQEELNAIQADMARLGYETGDRNEFDARGVDALAQAWKGRNWFERIVGVISELASMVGLPMSRLAAERAAARAVARHIKGKAEPFRQSVSGTFESRAEGLPNFFQTREQVELATQDPLLQGYQQQQLRELAAVQSSMVNDQFMDWFSTPAADRFNQIAKNLLEYIANRRNLSDVQQLYSNLPSGTDAEKRGKEAVGAIILAHYGVDRSTEAKINSDIDKKLEQLVLATAKLPKMNQQNMKAHFLTALFNRLTSDHRTYLVNLSRNAPAAQNLQAEFRGKLVQAERRLNEQVQAPGTLQRALSALATTVPDTLLAPGTTNGQIITWALNNGALATVVPQATAQWLLVDDGSGQPALLSYVRLREDLADLRDILTRQQQVQADIDAYEQWFSSTGRTGKISPKRFAENYFKFRTQRDRAARIAGAIEKEIGDLDTELRALNIAQNQLQSLIRSPAYVKTVNEAAQEADVVVKAIHNQANPLVGVGLIDRVSSPDGGAFWRLQVPEGNAYIVDLYPNRSQEDQNKANLGAYVSEARTYAAQHSADDPLLAAEHTRIADYIERFLLHPSLNPEQGFSQIGRLGIPGTNIKINISSSPFDWLSSLTGLFGFPFNTVRDAMERIGGRVTRQMMKDGYELDTVMKKVEGIDNNKRYGFAAQTQATLKALASHKWGPDQFGIWDEEIAEPVLAAGQTIGPKYNVGDYVIGSGTRLTREDVDALNLMKEWQDAIRAVAPAHIREQIGQLNVLRKAVGFGRYTMSRTSQEWTPGWVKEWNEATTPAQQLALLNKNENFRRVVMGYMGEFNPEFALMNNASDQKSPLFIHYRRLADAEKKGVQQFKTTEEVLDYIANEMYQVEKARLNAIGSSNNPDYVSLRNNAEAILLSEINQFTNAFNTNVLNAATESIWGAVPKAVVDVSTAKNTFTTPRGPLQAPSSFYTYSVASDARRQMHVGSLRSLLNLKLLQSMEEARAAMQEKKQNMDDEINRQIRTGKSAAAAKKTVVKESKRLRKLNEIQHDYEELVRVLKIMENISRQLQSYEQSSPSHYQHAGMEAMNAMMGTMKSGLLSSVQAVTTNTFGGLYLGPAIFHWQTGEHFRALRDILPSPIGGTASIISPLFKMISSAVANDPLMKKVLATNLPLFKQLASVIVQQADAWKRIQRIAETSGMVSPYNLRDQWANRQALPKTGGRFGTEKDASTLAMAINSILSGKVFPEETNPRLGKAANIPAYLAGGFAETIRSVFPRKFDDFINYALVLAFDRETEMLKKRGYEAFQAREASAATSGRNYRDLTDKVNILGPKELDLPTYQALERYRQIFAPLGSLDRVLLDFYERTKGLTPDQREAEPLIPDQNDHAGLALYYASISNPATETNRPLSFKRKGSSGEAVLRSTVGTFMGWVTNMMHQLSKGMQSHSKDNPSFIRAFVTVSMITILMAAVGAWNWELGDWATEFVTDVSSARIQPGNIEDVPTALAYLAQALVNTVPVMGPIIGSMAGVGFTGRGNPFDMTSQILHLNLASDTYNTFKRMVQTGDPILPWADWFRRWVFPSATRALLNRMPYFRGLIDQQNAIRSLSGSAPRDVELKWGQGGRGDVRYSPANDEIARVINAAYEATAHGGDVAEVRIAVENAVQAYIRAGRSRADAEKAVNVALAGKEPIRILTGREMTPEEEVRWVGRMTKGQKADYDKAVAAWRLLGNVTGRDLGFVNQPSSGTSGGGGRIAGLPATLPSSALPRPPSLRPPGFRSAGLLRSPSGGGLPTLRLPRATGVGAIRPSRSRLRRPGSRLRRPRLRRAVGPRVSAPRIRQRRISGGRRLRRR